MNHIKLDRLGKKMKPWIIYFLIVGLFYWIVYDAWNQTAVITDSASPSDWTSDIASDVIVQQKMLISMDCLNELDIMPHLLDNQQDVSMKLTWFDDGDQVIAEYVFDAVHLEQDTMVQLTLNPPIVGYKNRTVTLQIESEGGFSLWTGKSVQTGRLDIPLSVDYPVTVQNQPSDGQLVYKQIGSDKLAGTAWFWPIAVVVPVLVFLARRWAAYCREHGRPSRFVQLQDIITRYSYLLKQLVVRDFKVKYKSSFLGVIWSFLNPLLMTLVYYLVFSTLFRNDTENFVVYLMCGIILFNFFSESTSLGLNAIIGNASLITKVYIPKYVFPISKVLSASINLLISMIPLMLFMVILGVKFTKALLLIPVVSTFLIVFCIGVSLFLAAVTVFFRDVQFLWSVVLSIVNFLSPVFYPETIIPLAYRSLYHVNPMYQYMFFMRSIVLGGVSPTPVTYLYCFIASLSALIVGTFFFRKCQNQFSLYL